VHGMAWQKSDGPEARSCRRGCRACYGGKKSITRKNLVMNNKVIVILRQSRRIFPIRKGKDPSLFFTQIQKAHLEHLQLLNMEAVLFLH
jgi:hypothetical protein